VFKPIHLTAIGTGGRISRTATALIGPFTSKDEADKDAKETLGNAEAEV
jgi:hypothetical protein